MAIKKIKTPKNEVTEATQVALDLTDGFLEAFIKDSTDVKTVETLHTEDLKMIQETIRVYKAYKDLMMIMAMQQDEIYEYIKDINEKLDELSKRD